MAFWQQRSVPDRGRREHPKPSAVHKGSRLEIPAKRKTPQDKSSCSGLFAWLRRSPKPAHGQVVCSFSLLGAKTLQQLLLHVPLSGTERYQNVQRNKCQDKGTAQPACTLSSRCAASCRSRGAPSTSHAQPKYSQIQRSEARTVCGWRLTARGLWRRAAPQGAGSIRRFPALIFLSQFCQ